MEGDANATDNPGFTLVCKFHGNLPVQPATAGELWKIDRQTWEPFQQPLAKLAHSANHARAVCAWSISGLEQFAARLENQPSAAVVASRRAAI